MEMLKQSLMALTGFGSSKMEEIGIVGFAVVLLISLLSALLISSLYSHFYERRSTGSQIHRSFALLGLSVTSIFICIQFSLPLSLGLLGALSIVRFRTPIKEPEEIGFLMLVIASSIATATFNLTFLAIILSVAVVALLVQAYGPRFLRETSSSGMMLVSMPEDAYQTDGKKVMNLLEEKINTSHLESITKNGDRSVVSYSFTKFKREHFFELQEKLKGLEKGLELNVFFNKTATV